MKMKIIIFLLITSPIGLCGLQCIPVHSPFNACTQCSCNPLDSGSLDFQIHTGVCPIKWKDRSDLLLVDCNGADPVVPLQNLASFKTFFKLPWIIGGQIGYSWSDNDRLYLELNYARAKNKHAISAVNAANQTFIFNLNNYKVFDFYFGYRHYLDRWFQKVSFFIGAKVGMVTHHNVDFDLEITPPNPPFIVINHLAQKSFFNRESAISGGACLGIDWCINYHLSMVLTVDIVASCGPQSADNIFLTPNEFIQASNLFLARIGTEVRFPITLALRYSF